jgi:hypothetical protein
MTNVELSYFALPRRGKLLSYHIFTLEFGFVGGINIVPELVLLLHNVWLTFK